MCVIQPRFYFESMTAKSNFAYFVDITFVYIFLSRGLREKKFDK